MAFFFTARTRRKDAVFRGALRSLVEIKKRYLRLLIEARKITCPKNMTKKINECQ